MKPSKDLDEQIDEILETLAADAFIYGNFALGKGVNMKPSDNDKPPVEAAKQQLLALIEQREREARIDELTNFMSTMVTTHGDTPARSVSTAKIRERIEALKADK